MTERRPAGPSEDDPTAGFVTDQPVRVDRGPVEIDDSGDPVIDEERPGAAVITSDRAPEGDEAVAHPGPLAVLDVRPPPGVPRDYHFPRFERQQFSNGLTLITVDLPGRPLLYGQLLMLGGGAIEPPALAGATVLTARAMTEGTRRRDAIELVEAAERLGAELEAEAGWESLVAGISVPRSRFDQALALLAEVVQEPSFPEHEVQRLRDERLNDLMQARAEPRRRIERVFPETIYAPATPYARPLGGTEMTVPAIDRDAVVATHARLADPGSSTFVVAGDLRGMEVGRLVEEVLGDWRGAGPPDGALSVEPHPEGARVVVVDRPGSPQSEVRIGHVGVPRSTPDFHALSVLNTIVGGQFSSRLNKLLREERGYTYGVHSGFDMRRGAGPFAVRMAVQTEVTAPAIVDAMGELRRIREAPVEEVELDRARDYLIGVFPLRFEAAPQVAAAIAGLVVHDLPDDELDLYRPQVAQVSQEDVLAAAMLRIRPDEASVVVVGDAAAFESQLRDSGLGDVTVVHEESEQPEPPTD
jgi:zinc protease